MQNSFWLQYELSAVVNFTGICIVWCDIHKNISSEVTETVNDTASARIQ
jgi:hypothetical protein